MTARPKSLSARAIVDALWDDGDTHSDADMAARLGVSASTVRAYHQKWNRAHGQRNGRKLPPEIELAVAEMRNVGSMSFPDIAEVVRVDFGLAATTALVYECYRRGAQDELPVVLEVNEEDLPLETLAGVCWSVAINPPGASNAKRGKYADFCDFCPYRERCLDAELAHRFVGCEKPLQFEMMEIR